MIILKKTSKYFNIYRQASKYLDFLENSDRSGELHKQYSFGWDWSSTLNSAVFQNSILHYNPSKMKRIEKKVIATTILRLENRRASET